ncbi:hypothetical protein FGG08_004117 [Glutinoglossum americanum]|uniref:Uncharacterized protein n=1 Tax=Glutinoglossum americanum TaxID=1670608 RepID=A0A9P8IC15_9PEZI|nr:hypothetical protein FGG08_004117 [Glutinoglossum americanum]
MLTSARNHGELAEGWYDPSTKNKAQESASSFERSDQPSGQRRASPDYGVSENLPSVAEDEDSDDDVVGPALPKQRSSAKRSGPAIPKMDDLELRREMEMEDMLASREDLRLSRKMDRKLQKEQLDELVPRADAGTRERQLEKKREVNDKMRAFREKSPIEEVGEADLMGDDSLEGFKKKKKEVERKKNERELRKEEMLRTRAAEREERLLEHRVKEEKTMAMLRALAKQNFVNTTKFPACSAPRNALEVPTYSTLKWPSSLMASSSQSQNERNALTTENTEFSAVGERPAAYLTRPTAGIGSDKPLFTSRRKTVGLNPSSIPIRSESSDRNKETGDNHNDEAGTGQRRFLRTGAARTLKGAFEAAAEIMDGSQERNQGEEEGIGEYHQREYEAQAKHESPSFKRPAPLLRGGGTSVPGFYRDRRRSKNPSASLATAANSSNGLKEAYQRVVDAEISSMVGIEGIEGIGDISADIAKIPLSELLGCEGTDMAGLENAEIDEMRLQHLLNSTATIMGSPQAAGGTGVTDANYFDDKENNTAGSGHTAISGISSIIADETDDSFGRLLSTYAKDQQRVHGALSSDARVFSKPRAGSGLSTENLERRDTIDEAANDNMASMKIPDPPVQIPRDWGRKGRHGTEWLERIVGVGGKEGLHRQTEEVERDTVNGPAMAEDVPLPSIEDEPTLLPNSQAQVEAGPQARPQKSSVDRMREREEPTPPPQESLPHQNRSTLLDTIREREIESLRDRAVTTNRLGEIKERTSRESLRSRTSSEEKPDYKRDRRSSVRSEGSSSQRGVVKGAEDEKIKENKNSASIPVASVFVGEGEQIPFTPITIFKSSQQHSRPNSNRPYSEGNDKKSDIDGHDSRDVLRRLSRATSSSPNPTDDKQKTLDDRVAQHDLEDNSTTPRLPRSLKFEEPTPSFHVRGPGAWVDTPAAQATSSDPGSPPSDYDVDSEISALGLRDFIRGPSSSPLYTRSGGLKDRPSKPDMIPRRRKSEPAIPTTRRQAEVASAKPKDALGNDTDLSSLFDFNPDDADDTYAAIPTGDATHIPDRPRPLTNAERERQREMLVYECLNRRLRTLQTEIAEAKRGIEGLESKMTQDAGAMWVRTPDAVTANGNDFTLTIRIPGKKSVRSFIRSVLFNRRWRWLRWSFYAWCFFWIYATIEMLFFIHSVTPVEAASGPPPKHLGWLPYHEQCYPHPWTTLLQLTRPLTWIWVNVLRLEPLGEPMLSDWRTRTGPWKGSFVRRVFDWNWDMSAGDCKPPIQERNPVYQIFTWFMRELNFAA